MMNPGNVCYANSCLIGLTWITVLMGMLDSSHWPDGHEVILAMVTNSWLPLSLAHHMPFLRLLDSGWSLGDLNIQQDAADFLHWLLLRLQPDFIDCSWSASHLRTIGFDELRDGTEKGGKHSLIQISLRDPESKFCSLQSMIDAWHDPLGLCRCSLQVGTVLILQISRYLDMRPKCTQTIDFDATVPFPIFDAAGNTHFYPFDIAGCIIHFGATPTTGHYRTALATETGWMVYEDDALPDFYAQLPADFRSNIILFFLTPSVDEPVRTFGPGASTADGAAGAAEAAG